MSAISSGTGGEATGGTVDPTHHLQQVIEAQRSQLALLQNISQYITNNKVVGDGGVIKGVSAAATENKGAQRPRPGLPPQPVPFLGQDHVTTLQGRGVGRGTGGGMPSRLIDRTQTFDYGNHSNKVLEQEAAQQLENDAFYRD